MEEKIFINRIEELDTLIAALNQTGPELIILYGRRRIGKSRLLKEATKQVPVDIFVMLEEADYQTNLTKVTQLVGTKYQFPNFAPSNFKDLFSALPHGAKIILDEFAYLPRGTAEFQVIWEEIAKGKNLKIVLSGSFIRIMEDLAFSLQSPLYGRATRIIKLLPLRFSHVREWYQECENLENIFAVYCAVGGVPRYLELIAHPSLDCVKTAFFARDSILLREGKLLLKESFPTSLVIPKILFAITTGTTQATHIAHQVQVKPSEISKYLGMLVDYGFVERKFPVLGGGKKDVRFYPADRFFTFWTHFIWKYYNEIETGILDQVLQAFDIEWKKLMGLEFERLALELIQTTRLLPNFHYTTAGRQWGKIPAKLNPNAQRESYEIDICLVNENEREILLGECKWQEEVSAEAIAKELIRKAAFVEWNNDSRQESFILFARSFRKKITKFDGRRFQCFDLKDIDVHITQILKSGK